MADLNGTVVEIESDVVVVDGTPSNHADLFPLSKSKLSSYDFCPLQFKKKYIDKVPQGPAFQLSIGVRVHNLFDQFFDVCDDLPVERWPEFVNDLDEFTQFERDMVSWFIKMEQHRYKIYRSVPYKPIIREDDLYSQVLPVHGIPDRVDQIDPDLVPYMRGEISQTSLKRIKKQLEEGNKLLCIIEYKSGASFYIPGLKKEVSFYKMCIEGSGLYDDYIVACGCVINPRLRKIAYMDFELDKTTTARINSIAWNIQNNVFPVGCTYAKYNACKLCDLVEAELSSPYD